jgi:putative membrane protein
VSEPAAPPAEEWRRTSATSFVVNAVMALRNALLPMAAAAFSTQGLGLIVMLPMVAAATGFSALFSYIAWRHFRYRLTDSDIRVERGLFNRTARSVPYERIQDVSLEQKFVPRLFGMVDVKFETGAGGKDEVRIRYVSAEEAEGLRETVRARKSGEVIAAVEPALAAAEGPARTLFAMDTRRLLTFGLFEFSLVVFAVLAGAVQQFDFLLPFDPFNPEEWIRLLAGPGHWVQELGFAAQVIGVAIGLILLGILGLVTGVGRTVLRDYGFKLEETAKGLRRRRGLLTRTDVVMPVHRVQALKVTTGILRRRWGWHGLSVVSLSQDAKSGNHVVVPFARMDEIAPVVGVTGFELPGAGIDWRRSSAKHKVDQALLCAIPFSFAAVAAGVVANRFDPPLGWAAAAGFAALAGLFVLRENFLWRHDRSAIDDRHIFAKHGWLAPKVDIASRVKLQSVEIRQGPLARRRGYANLTFGIAGGTLAIAGIPLEEARAIRRAALDSITGIDFSRLNKADQSTA